MKVSMVLHCLAWVHFVCHLNLDIDFGQQENLCILLRSKTLTLHIDGNEIPRNSMTNGVYKQQNNRNRKRMITTKKWTLSEGHKPIPG